MCCMKLNGLFFLTFMFSDVSIHAQVNTDRSNQQPEIIYHLFQRSFYDSNGDLYGDLNGIISKLDLQPLKTITKRY